jgi:hypothetical protein
MYRTMKEMAADWNWPCNGEEVSMGNGEKLKGVRLVLVGMVIYRRPGEYGSDQLASDPSSN